MTEYCVVTYSESWSIDLYPPGVKAGLVPAIHALLADTRKNVDARDNRGHDGPRGDFAHVATRYNPYSERAWILFGTGVVPRSRVA